MGALLGRRYEGPALLLGYVKLIAQSAGLKKNYCFIVDRFQKLQHGELTPSSNMGEYRKEIKSLMRGGGKCFYRGSPN